jgi:regulator of sirC expression with transglutaminase-like and TPR domain
VRATAAEERRFVAVPFVDSPEFQRLLAGDGKVHLARIALEIGRDAYPEIEIESYLEKIEDLSDRVRSRYRAGAKVRDILGQVNWVLFVEEEFRGNREDYYDPRNSYLNEVLDRGLGIPISLSLLYWAVAERSGLAIAGVDLPLHFMLRVDDEGQPWFVDPFHGGAVYDRSGCVQKLSEIAERSVSLHDAAIEPCSDHVLISRMLRNLKVIYGRSGEVGSLLPIQRRLTALNRQQPGELRDLGVLCVQADRLGEAIEPLEAYLNLSPAAEDAGEIRELLGALRREVSHWN